MNHTNTKFLIFSLFIISLFYLIFYNMIVPAEDALMNFNHAASLANRGIFTYGNVDFKIEGSVDLLWILYLAFFSKLGLTEYTTALITTLFSFCGILYLLLEKCYQVKLQDRQIFSILFISFLCIFLTPYLWSGIVGFSSIVFTFIFLLILKNIYNDNSKPFWIFCLIICLIRPDGTVWITGPILIRLFFFKESFLKEFKNSLIFFAIPGLICFLSRWYYFGNFFPLPFYVKSSGVRDFFGIFFTDSIIKSSYILIPFILSYLFFRKEIDIKKIFYIFIIPLVFYFEMSLEMNIGNRFFSPLFFGITYLVLTKNTKILKIFLILCVLVTARFSTDTIATAISSKNENLFYISKDLSEFKGRMLVTETGKTAYYSNWKVEDAYGIVNPKYAKRIIQSSDLKVSDYDMFYLHCNLNYIGKENVINSKKRTWDNVCKNIVNFINDNNSNYMILLSPYRKPNENSIYSNLREIYKMILSRFNQDLYLGGTQGCYRHDMVVLNLNYEKLNSVKDVFLKHGAVPYDANFKYNGDLYCKK